MSDIISIRISKAEKKQLAKVAKLSGMSLSAFLRFSALTEARKLVRPILLNDIVKKITRKNRHPEV